MPKLNSDVFLCRIINQDVSKVILKFGGVFLEDPMHDTVFVKMIIQVQKKDDFFSSLLQPPFLPGLTLDRGAILWRPQGLAVGSFWVPWILDA